MLKVMQDLMKKQKEKIPESSRNQLSFAVYNKEKKTKCASADKQPGLPKCVVLLLPKHHSKDYIIPVLLGSLSNVWCCPFTCVRKHYHLHLLTKEIVITDVSKF
jgi:hypothetical protein